MKSILYTINSNPSFRSIRIKVLLLVVWYCQVLWIILESNLKWNRFKSYENFHWYDIVQCSMKLQNWQETTTDISKDKNVINNGRWDCQILWRKHGSRISHIFYYHLSNATSTKSVLIKNVIFQESEIGTFMAVSTTRLMPLKFWHS